MHIEPMTDRHTDAVLRIYQAGINEGNATFETSAPSWRAFTATRLPAHRYVATEHDAVLGWVAASAVSDRCVYNGVVEDSVYVSPHARGLGIGRQLLETLIASTEQPESGPSSPASSPRTPPALPSTTPPDSETSASASASASITDAGATRSSSNDAAP
jgi:GNAT superfamily N-acetyltransferase